MHIGHGTTLLQIETRVFQRHNLTHSRLESPNSSLLTPKRLERIIQVLNALKGTNGGAAGPDNIGYRLLEPIKDSNLGQAITNDIANCLPAGGRAPYPIPNQWRQITMVVILKPNKDNNTVKGWSVSWGGQTRGQA